MFVCEAVTQKVGFYRKHDKMLLYIILMKPEYVTVVAAYQKPIGRTFIDFLFTFTQKFKKQIHL